MPIFPLFMGRMERNFPSVTVRWGLRPIGTWAFCRKLYAIICCASDGAMGMQKLFQQKKRLSGLILLMWANLRLVLTLLNSQISMAIICVGRITKGLLRFLFRLLNQ